MINAFDPEQLHRVLADSAAALVRQDGDDDLESVLTRLCAAAVAHVPGAAYAGLTLRGRDGAVGSHGATDPVVAELDRLRIALGEGPVPDPPAGGPDTVTVDDLAAEDGRWPGFAPAARARGIHGLLSFAMAPTDASPGTLTLYATRPGAFDDSSRMIAGAFAMQAAVALSGARRISGLTGAVATRDVIGQAKGVLMERFTLDDRGAFDLLVRSSQDANVKLVEVAREIANGVGRATGPRALGRVPAVEDRPVHHRA